MQIIEKGMSIIQIVGPIVVFAIAVLTAWGMIKWGKNMGLAFKEFAESPLNFVFAIIIIAAFLYMYFKLVVPLFPEKDTTSMAYFEPFILVLMNNYQLIVS